MIDTSYVDKFHKTRVFFDSYDTTSYEEMAKWCRINVGDGGAWGGHVFRRFKWLAASRIDGAEFLFEHKDDLIQFVMSWG